MFHTGCERWNTGWFEGQADCCERGWFIVWKRPVLFWIIFLWYSRNTVFEWQLVLYLWRWHKLDCLCLIKKGPSFGIVIRFLSGSTVRMLGQDNHKKTEYVIYIPFSIMFVWYISLILLLITFNCFLHVFFLPYQKDTHELANATIIISGIGIYNTLCCMESFLFWTNRTTFR